MKIVEVIKNDNIGIPRSEMPQIHIDDIKGKYNYKQGKVSIDKLKPVQRERIESEYNKAVEKIEDGQVKPIMLDKKFRIVNGHHRHDAYKDLGYERVPAVLVDATLEELMQEFAHTAKKDIGEDNKLLDKPTLSVAELADKHGVDINVIKSQLMKGIKVELEHTSDPKIAKEIALDHIAEKPDYYDRLEDVEENFADGKVKGKSRPGRVKKAGASCKGSVTDLRAKAKKYSGERGKMYHWCANMKSGKKK